MVGFALYAEIADIKNLAQRSQEVLCSGRSHKSVWRALVEDTLQSLGGHAPLDSIYAAIEPHRPSETTWWREKVRQQLQLHFTRTSRGEYSFSV